MDISYNWLKDLIEIDLSPQELAEKLTSVGLAVEKIEAKDDDFVLDVDVTSNRADCHSHLGVAREIAVIEKSKVQLPHAKSLAPAATAESNGRNVGAKIENLTSVKVEDTELCPRYTARVIQGVKIAPSPEWLQKRLRAIDQRPINNVADITNYVMHELGQPLHAFDFDKLAERQIIVRRATDGEKMRTLDGAEREFDENVLLICDAEKAVAIGGVMGGENSAISDQTVNVLIEAAYFKRESVRRTQRKLNLHTEAGYRFERGVDIENVLRASNRCVELICEIAGGVASETAIDVYPNPAAQIEIPFRPARVAALTGLEVEAEEMLRILAALGFQMREDAAHEGITFVAPSWRIDMEREEDLIEEIARQTGYDKIAEELPPSRGAGEYQPNEPRKKALRQTLADLSFNEAINYSFINVNHDDKIEFLPGLIDEFAEEKFVTLRDAVIEGAVRLRPTLLVGLLDAVRRNLNFGERNLKLFEIGRVFAGFGGIGSLPTEKEAFALVLTGGEMQASKAETVRELDFYDAKGALEAAIAAIKLPELNFASAKVKHLRDGQAAEVLFGGERIGFIGRLAEESAASYKFKQAVFVAEVDLQKLLAVAPQPSLYQPLPTKPAISRDVSLLVKRGVAFGELRKFIAAQNAEFLQRVEFVDVYEGKGVGEDERSLTIRFEYRVGDRTLRDEEVQTSHQQILQAVEERFGAKLRL